MNVGALKKSKKLLLKERFKLKKLQKKNSKKKRLKMLIYNSEKLRSRLILASPST